MIESMYLNDAAVAQYLRDNPDFFEHHPEILEALKLSTRHEDGTVSFTEHRLSQLRKKNEALDEQLEELKGHAVKNEVRSQRIHRLALTFLENDAPEMLLDNLIELLRSEFDIPMVAICFHGARSESDTVVDERFLSVEPEFKMLFAMTEASLEPISRSQLSLLFSDVLPKNFSSAVIPVFHKSLPGFIVLVRHSPNGFTEEMGTHFLNQLGELVCSGLARFAK